MQNTHSFCLIPIISIFSLCYTYTKQKWWISYHSIFSFWSVNRTETETEWEGNSIEGLLLVLVNEGEKDGWPLSTLPSNISPNNFPGYYNVCVCVWVRLCVCMCAWVKRSETLAVWWLKCLKEQQQQRAICSIAAELTTHQDTYIQTHTGTQYSIV